MPKPDSNPVAANLEPWSNDPWTNGIRIFPVKIIHDPDENHNNLLRVDTLAEPKIKPKIRTRMR